MGDVETMTCDLMADRMKAIQRFLGGTKVKNISGEESEFLSRIRYEVGDSFDNSVHCHTHVIGTVLPKK